MFKEETNQMFAEAVRDIIDAFLTNISLWYYPSERELTFPHHD